MREVLKFYIPLAMIVIAGFALALWFANPAPPDRIRMATGLPGGAYAAFGERYRNALVCRSLPQSVAQVTRMSTSPAASSGSAMRRSSRGRPTA